MFVMKYRDFGGWLCCFRVGLVENSGFGFEAF